MNTISIDKKYERFSYKIVILLKKKTVWANGGGVVKSTEKMRPLPSKFFKETKNLIPRTEKWKYLLSLFLRDMTERKTH